MKYDLHVHTHYSGCSNLNPLAILKILKKKCFNGVAITDHNTIKGGIAVKEANKDKDFEVIVGSEIKTEYGEILGLYLQEEIRSNRLLEVLDNIKKQGGLAIIAHPYRILSKFVKFGYPIIKLVNKINGIECINLRSFPFENKWANELAGKLNIAKVGSSDAHFRFEVGRGFTSFDSDLRKALKFKKTIPGYEGGISNIFRHIITGRSLSFLLMAQKRVFP